MNLLSIVMAAATLCISVASFRTFHIFEMVTFHGSEGEPFVVGCYRGVLYFAASDVKIDTLHSYSIDHAKWPSLSLESCVDLIVGRADWQFGYLIDPNSPNAYPSAEPKWFGFSLGKGSNALTIPGTWYVFASVPAWFLGPLLAVYPLRRSFGWWRSRRRRMRGLCPECAYDLRESPGRCPECGYAR